MELSRLLKGVETLAVTGPVGVSVNGLCYDSRQVRAGHLFAAIRGEHLDGNEFVAAAIEAGAIAVLSERRSSSHVRPTWIQVPSARRALARVAANFYGHPARALKLVGITGTNGKTTTSFLLESILLAAGERTGLFGTIEYHTATGTLSARQTTPESLDLQHFLAELRDARAPWAVMEVSSHGLALDRVTGCPFAAAVFTNLARDHLDFHQTFANYFNAKKQLFLGCGAQAPPLCILNADDPHSQELQRVASGRVVLYSLEEDKEVAVTARRPQLNSSGTRFTLQTPAGNVALESPLVGRSNFSNLLAAAATAYALEIPLHTIAAGIRALKRVPGRFERVEAGQPFSVVVDFAHTDLAFANLLQTARELTPGRVILVFGCGGDRDRTKRPVMGEIAGRAADKVVLTTDNPRSEDPARIINDIVVGVQKAAGDYTIEVDRERAFEKAFAGAAEGDMVLLAGKGHQDTQVYRDHVEPWSDVEVARRVLTRCGFARAQTAGSNARS
ncbi:MAG: UDP-N-acetylmuramoyl-L-alanyl-D-glutamate--2,6-diaminopimelate ligase [Terriglobia bacterium]